MSLDQPFGKHVTSVLASISKPLNAIVSKLKDPGALLLIALYVLASGASRFVDPIIAFGASTAMGISFMVYRVAKKLIDGRNKGREIDAMRDIELAKIQRKLGKRTLAPPASRSRPNGPKTSR